MVVSSFLFFSFYHCVQAEAPRHTICMQTGRRGRDCSDVGDKCWKPVIGTIAGFGLADSGNKRRSIPVPLESADAGLLSGLAVVVGTGSNSNHRICNHRHLRSSGWFSGGPFGTHLSSILPSRQDSQFQCEGSLSHCAFRSPLSPALITSLARVNL